MRLAQKLTLFLVLGMCLVLVLESWMSIRHEIRVHAADMRHDQHVTGQAMGAAIAELWSTGGRDRALALIDRASLATDRSSVRWIEFDAPPGDRFASQLPASALEPVRTGAEVQREVGERNGPGRFITVVPVRIGAGIPGALELSESLAETRRYVRATVLRRVGTGAALGALSALVAILVGALFVGGPIRRLVDKAERIAAGDLTGTLDLHQRDEIGELGRAIDDMCVRLQQARDRIAAETTARIEAIERLRHADRLATVGRLASGVAHELGTPLNVVSHRAKMIASGEVTGGDAADGARIIAEQSRRMTDVIRQMLGFARRHVPDKARQDLRFVARQSAQLLAPLAERRGTRLRVEEGPAGVYAEVDAGQIQQALTNLIVNGIQATEDGGEISVTVGSRAARPPAEHGGASGTYACLEVRDQGRGIPPEDLPHVFEPFFTTKLPGEGTGLGLAVAQGIVGDHGGWMEVESVQGRGSRFSIFLPCDHGPARAESGIREGAGLARGGAGGAAGGSRRARRSAAGGGA